MSDDQFSKRAQNVVTLVGQLGSGSSAQVAEIMRDVHRCAIEMVAEDFNKRAAQAMKDGKADVYNFLQSQVATVRRLKNGNPNL
jgi:hypothetical protein